MDAIIASEHIMDILYTNGGLHLYDQYLRTKDKAHCCRRMIQNFSEGI